MIVLTSPSLFIHINPFYFPPNTSSVYVPPPCGDIKGITKTTTTKTTTAGSTVIKTSTITTITTLTS